MKKPAGSFAHEDARLAYGGRLWLEALVFEEVDRSGEATVIGADIADPFDAAEVERALAEGKRFAVLYRPATGGRQA